MNQQQYNLCCVKCKTSLIVRSSFYDNTINFKLVICPNCKAPLREIRNDREFVIERVS